MAKLSKSQKAKADKLRTVIMGYVGGLSVTSKATDGELLILCDIQDQRTQLHNAALGQERVYHSLCASIRDRE